MNKLYMGSLLNGAEHEKMFMIRNRHMPSGMYSLNSICLMFADLSVTTFCPLRISCLVASEIFTHSITVETCKRRGFLVSVPFSEKRKTLKSLGIGNSESCFSRTIVSHYLNSPTHSIKEENQDSSLYNL